MKLNVAICDDEKIISKMIYSKLIDLRSEYSVDIYESGRCLLDSEKIYDLIFLDIEMPGIDGMKTAEQLRANSSGEFIIFLSNHTEFMPDAFKVKAFRFLSKPINDKDFIEAVLQAEKEILINEKISFSEKGCTMLIKINDIVCVEAFGDGTFIHTVNEVIESTKSLKYWINQLGNEHFYQVHKSYLVSFRHIKSIGTTQAKMHYMKELVPISRRKYTCFKKTFINYVKKNAKYIRSVPMKKIQFFKTSIFSYSSVKEVLLFIIGLDAI